MNTIHMTRSIAVTLVCAFLGAGCESMGGSSKPKTQMTTDEALRVSTDQAIPVPQGSIIVAKGRYPLAQFAVPREGGRIYVYDETANKVVFMTTYQADSTSPSAADLSQRSWGAQDPTHDYRVYYLPPQPMVMPPTPAPAYVVSPTTQPGTSTESINSFSK